MADGGHKLYVPYTVNDISFLLLTKKIKHLLFHCDRKKYHRPDKVAAVFTVFIFYASLLKSFERLAAQALYLTGKNRIIFFIEAIA